MALARRLLCSSPVAVPSPHPSPGGIGGVRAERESLTTDNVVTQACGRCRSCGFIEAGTHPDFLHITFEPTDKGDKLRSELVVDQVRRCGEWLSKTPQFGGPQVVVVAPADALNAAAANALLKTLEEPAGNRYLLLATSQPGRLPATIRSRCQRLEFRLPDGESARTWRRARDHADADIDAALAASRGHPGLAAEWLTNGGLKLRAQVQAELDAVGRGRASAVETAQRWLADDAGDQRLRFAADLALEGVARATQARAGQGAALAVPGDADAVGAWFDALNRMRVQLAAPLRHDLILAGLLRDWRAMLQSAPAGPGQGERR
jgi:DNA polymerase III subunit delta'